jgi:hypothetical protein
MTIKAPRLALVVAGALACVVCLPPIDLSAQDRETLQTRLTLPPLPTYQPEPPPPPPPETRSYIFPSITITSPSALGAEGGTVYAGANYQERTRYLDEDDGAVVAGVGLWDSRKYVGIDLAVVSFSTVRSGFFDRVGFDVQVHRTLNDRTAVAIGAENLFMINGSESDHDDTSVYGVVTQLFPLRSDPLDPFSLITATLGVGNGRFRLEDDIWEGNSTVMVFGALSVHIVRPVAVIADWSGQDLGVGLSLAPFEHFPLSITPAVIDLTHNAGDGARFVIGMGVGYRWATGPIQF